MPSPGMAALLANGHAKIRPLLDTNYQLYLELAAVHETDT
jgi:hypothetical protein